MPQKAQRVIPLSVIRYGLYSLTVMRMNKMSAKKFQHEISFTTFCLPVKNEPFESEESISTKFFAEPGKNQCFENLHLVDFPYAFNSHNSCNHE